MGYAIQSIAGRLLLAEDRVARWGSNVGVTGFWLAAMLLNQ